ncbi:hypothetical protein PRZ48_012574 [Zasmidium cellare]|uniref:F-box domain-containing protein n=1 Tax=Zasmidium cellare TaxID=395010 RepID=A0ABR0E592_ZASCE|nr:hypothetical protein PRZ48_012574 [Zasmidium cellare]
MALSTRKRKPSTDLQAEDIKNTKTSDTSQPEQKTGITSLPKELLIQIIGYALIKPHPITLHNPWEHRWAKEVNSLKELSSMKRFKRSRKSDLAKVLSTCRDFYFAGLEAYYGGNTFRFGSPADFRDKFTRVLNPRQTACVKSVMIDWEWHVYVQWETGEVKCFPRSMEQPRWDLLEGFPELQSATIGVYMAKEPVVLAAASRADAAKAEIRKQVFALWPEQASKIEVTFPESWGRLADM